MFCPSCGSEAHYDPSNHYTTCLNPQCGAQYKVDFMRALAEDDEFFQNSNVTGDKDE